MTGFYLDGAFVVYPGGYLCSNEGVINVDAETVKGPDGVITAVKRTKVLRIKKAFTQNKSPEHLQNVNCLVRLSVGSVFRYDGYFNGMDGAGSAEIILTSIQKIDGIQELKQTIFDL